MMNNSTAISKKSRYKTLFRWMFTSCISLNYEKLLSTGYCYAMLPVLEELYKDEEERKNSVKTHLEFFNCNPWTAPYILGLNVSIEEQKKNEGLQTVASLKTALMGPLSALGDTVLITIPWSIFGAIASYMALQGSVLGVFIWLFVSLLLLGLSIPLFNAGYKSGALLLNSLHKKMSSINAAISVVGLMVVGALIPTVVKATLGFEYKVGDVNIKLSELSDQIMPYLIPAILTFGVYQLLNRYKMSPTKVICSILLLSVLTYVTGILK